MAEFLKAGREVAFSLVGLAHELLRSYPNLGVTPPTFVSAGHSETMTNRMEIT